MRYLISIGVLLVVIAGIVGIKFKQISGLIAMGAAAQKSGPPPEVVGSTRTTEDNWEGTLSAVGSVAPVRGVAVSSEAPGVVSAIRFSSGDLVRAGQVLVELDTSVERAQLASAEARKELAAVSAGRSRQLAGSAAISKAQLDGDEAQLKTSSADFSALKAQIDRKTVRAPFAGRLGIRNVNLGQYLNPGTAVTVLESQGAVYVDFSLPQQQLEHVKVGMPVQVNLSGNAGPGYTGAIGAIDPTLDATTRSVKLRASVPNKEDKLRPGMFVSVSVSLGAGARVVITPATAVVHASYGDSVFVVEDKKDEAGAVVKDQEGKPQKVARQQFVRLGAARGDFVALLDGVKAGEELVTAGAFKLRNGSGVIVSNEVRPNPSLTPSVENR